MGRSSPPPCSASPRAIRPPPAVLIARARLICWLCRVLDLMRYGWIGTLNSDHISVCTDILARASLQYRHCSKSYNQDFYRNFRSDRDGQSSDLNFISKNMTPERKAQDYIEMKLRTHERKAQG